LRPGILGSAGCAAIVSIAAAAPAEAAGHSSRPGLAPSAHVRLSNERTFTRSANAVAAAYAYARPSPKAHRVGRLRLLTEDGFPEVYVVLAGERDARGAAWVRIRLPQRPNNVKGWVRARALGPMHTVHTRLVVDRHALRITLYDEGRRRFRARVGMGAPGTPTPAGSFWIREKFPVSGNPLYGPRAMGTAAYSNVLTDWPGGGVIGIHGTSEPGLIPGRPSHGCIRLRNADIRRLYALTPIGTPLRVTR
jgi:lipoprotein-anchoring transpeptidase ErfK/SrfK